MSNQRIAVLGGGISGLTAAFWLHRAGANVTVYECQSFPGGTMRTVHDNGWTVETGPTSALETTPLFGEMFEMLGITAERAYANPSSDKRFILRDGALQVMPLSPPAFLKTRLWTLSGKLRLLKEPFIGRADKEETIAEFVERRLGREFLDYAINPFVAGVYAGNPEQLSVRAAFPKLYALEEKYGGLIKGMIGGARERKRRAEKAKDRSRMFSFQHGMQTFPDAIARELGNRFVPDHRATAIKEPGSANGGPRFEIMFETPEGIRKVDTDALILAVPSYVASKLLAPLVPSLSALLESVYYPPVAEVFLGYKAEQVGRSLDGFGFLIPAKEKRRILGTIWSSSLFPNRAPAGHVALTTFVGGSRQPEMATLSDVELLQTVKAELASLLNAEGDPVYGKIFRWDRAIPQYNVGYHHTIEAIETAERAHAGLFVCSNYRGGIAVGDCVMNGRKTADRLLALGLPSHQAVAGERELG